MENTKIDYNNRSREIENYIQFLIIFDKEETKLEYEKDGQLIKENIDIQFQTILIANIFILLYNLIESTVRNSILEIYQNIEDENVNFRNLSINLKKMYIKHDSNLLKEGTFRPDTIKEFMLNFSDLIISNRKVVFQSNWIDFSGNLDAQEIRNIAETFGFEISRNGRKLVEIKNKRNRLAHGEQTFYEVGRDFSINDITEFKTNTFNFLEDFIGKVEAFISNKNFIIEN